MHGDQADAVDPHGLVGVERIFARPIGAADDDGLESVDRQQFFCQALSH